MARTDSGLAPFATSHSALGSSEFVLRTLHGEAKNQHLHPHPDLHLYPHPSPHPPPPATFGWNRLLGGRRGGAKKRDHGALSAALPSRKAWQDEWAKPGAEGGMEVTVLDAGQSGGLRPETS